jgi:hypothetical protein
MLQLFRAHPAEKNQTFCSHFKFAFLMGLRLGAASIFFLTHAFLPFIPVPKNFNCHDLIHALVECERW